MMLSSLLCDVAILQMDFKSAGSTPWIDFVVLGLAIGRAALKIPVPEPPL